MAELVRFGISIPGPLLGMRGVKHGKLTVASAGHL